MGPIERKNKIIMIIIIILLFFIIAGSIYIIAIASGYFPDEESYVIEVIDGDTFRLNTGETIRMLCINTPEVGEPGYEEAKTFLENLILNKPVILEPGETLNQTDKYGRSLAYVYTTNLDNEVFINKVLIDAGYSEIYEYGDSEEECKEVLG